jgi:NADPH-dependent glutamate synthase beta subunit-like oxidoreductase
MSNLEQLLAEPRHLVVICGGAVSGSEAAALCASRGMLAVVLEQNTRPYGKIEDGLPRWHDKLRRQEYARIDENLTRPGVLYVPRVTLGRDLKVPELAARPGVSAVLLANGAWRDRPLALAGVDQLQGKGFVYQNPFVYWFNHYEDNNYAGPAYGVEQGAIVIGGGLASIDVAKIINLELYRNALALRGIDVSTVELEHTGIPKTLAAHHLNAEELGIEGATIFYRRRIQDMPIAFPKDNTPEQIKRTELVREKMVKILGEKYLLRVKDCHIPVATLSDGERLRGLCFRRSRMDQGKLVEVAGSDYDVESKLVVSSIGSVPEPLPDIPRKGELYDFVDAATGAVRGQTGVFGLGNVLTGQGNIKDSRENAHEIIEHAVLAYLGIGDSAGAEALPGEAAARREQIANVIDRTVTTPKATPDELRAFMSLVYARWREVNYPGDYATWIERHRPT